MKRFLIVVAVCVLTCWAQNGAHAAVEKLGTYSGPGAIDGHVVGPGPTAGSQRLYLAYMYVNRTVDLVSVNPENGEWRSFQNPDKSEFGAIMGLGPDGKIYLGTRPHAHLYQLDPATGSYRDLGQPVPGEAYVYGLATGTDGKLYGCTYPSASLFRYDTASGKFEDLGRMDPGEQYAKSIAASSDGFIYVGIGSAQAHVVAYQISSGKHRDVLPASVRKAIDPDGEGSTATVHRGDDGKIYATVGNRYFLVKDWTAREIPKSEVRPHASETRLKDGRIVTVVDRELNLKAPGSSSVQREPYSYPGRQGAIFRVGMGPDGRVYGSSILPFHLFAVNVNTKRTTKQTTDLGRLGIGEAYSFASYRGKLYIAVYDGDNRIPLMVFDPARPFAPGASPDSNPVSVTYRGVDPGWRPEAMVFGPGGKFYIGSVAGYGSVDGPLTVLDPSTNQVTKFSNVVSGESVVSLAALKHLVAGGTSIYGGGGSHPTESQAKLFLWDPASKKKIYESVPVSGASTITDLLALPGGKVMGIATGVKSRSAPSSGGDADGSVLFVFDVNARKFVYTLPFNFKDAIYNSVALGPDHAVWGLVQDGIFRFDPASRRLQFMEKTPAPVTAGFDLHQGSIYYASGPSVYRYRIPLHPAKGH